MSDINLPSNQPRVNHDKLDLNTAQVNGLIVQAGLNRQQDVHAVEMHAQIHPHELVYYLLWHSLVLFLRLLSSKNARESPGVKHLVHHELRRQMFFSIQAIQIVGFSNNLHIIHRHKPYFHLTNSQ